MKALTTKGIKDIVYVIRGSFLGNYDISHCFFFNTIDSDLGSHPFSGLSGLSCSTSRWMKNKAKWYTQGKIKWYSWVNTDIKDDGLSSSGLSKDTHSDVLLGNWNSVIRKLGVSQSSRKLFYYFPCRASLCSKEQPFKDNTVLKYWEERKCSWILRSY